MKITKEYDLEENSRKFTAWILRNNLEIQKERMINTSLNIVIGIGLVPILLGCSPYVPFHSENINVETNCDPYILGTILGSIVYCDPCMKNDNKNVTFIDNIEEYNIFNYV